MKLDCDYNIVIVDQLKQLEKELQHEWFLDPNDIQERLNAVDWEYTATLDGTITSVKMIRTLGGPFCHVEFMGDGTARVVTHFNGVQQYLEANLPGLDDWAWNLIEDVRMIQHMTRRGQ